MIAQQGRLEISRGRLKRNVETLQVCAGGASICATIKANAYGHGCGQIVPMLLEERIRWACVYSLREAVELMAWPWEGILVLSPVMFDAETDGPAFSMLAQAAAAPVRFNLTCAESARQLSAFAQGHGSLRLPVHVQVDCGLTRVGVDAHDAAELVDLVSQLPGLRLEGVFAHFSHGDVPGDVTVERQLALFQKVTAPLKRRHPRLMLHMQNSGGAMQLGNVGLDMVRIGIALYGLQPSTRDAVKGLLPVARVVAPVLAVHDRPAGTGVGYGHTFVTNRASRLAVVPVGYADGYPRQMSNRAVAQIRGMDVPVVGRVSMDQIILDVTQVGGEAVSPGEITTVISWDAETPNSLDRMADTIGTIGYELATHLGGRLQRTVVN
jgi:alanine racemase